MRDTRCGMLGDDVRRIEISDRQNREGQHPLSASPRAGYRRDWLIVWPLESVRAHGGLTELGNADLTDTQVRRRSRFRMSKTMVRAQRAARRIPRGAEILGFLSSPKCRKALVAAALQDEPPVSAIS